MYTSFCKNATQTKVKRKNFFTNKHYTGVDGLDTVEREKSYNANTNQSSRAPTSAARHILAIASAALSHFGNRGKIACDQRTRPHLTREEGHSCAGRTHRSKRQSTEQNNTDSCIDETEIDRHRHDR